jgi:hypothetical protein
MFSQQQRLGGRVAHSLLQLTTTAKASPKRRSCSRPAIMLCIDMSSSNLEQQGLRIQELGRSKHWGESLTLIDPRYRQTTVGSTHLLQLPSTSRDQAIGERASPWLIPTGRQISLESKKPAASELQIPSNASNWQQSQAQQLQPNPGIHKAEQLY